MADVNFVEYGENALRVTDTAGDGLEFLAMNGYEIGTLFALFIIIVIILGILILMFKYGRKLLP